MRDLAQVLTNDVKVILLLQILFHHPDLMTETIDTGGSISLTKSVLVKVIDQEARVAPRTTAANGRSSLCRKRKSRFILPLFTLTLC